MRRRSHICSVTILWLVCYCGSAAGEGREPRLQFLGDFNVPTGTPFASIGADDKAKSPQTEVIRSVEDRLRGKALGVFGGISAIAFDNDSGRLLALSDSAKPILFTFQVSLDEQSFQLRPLQAIRLMNRQGAYLAEWSMDPEGLALLPQGNLLIASEGFPAGLPRIGVGPTNPAIHLFARRGRLMQELQIPTRLLGTVEDSTGTHPNQGLESLTIAPDGKRIYVAAEGTLKQDGPPSDLNNGCRIRILECSLGEHEMIARYEYLYEVQPPPIPAGFRSPRGNRGLSELLALGDGQLLSLERSFVAESVRDAQTRKSDQRIEIYHVNLLRESEVTAAGSLREAGQLRPLPKKLVLDLRDVVSSLDPQFQSLDNFEGMCFGPTLDDGSPTLLLVSDNNFNPQQRTAFLAFRLHFD